MNNGTNLMNPWFMFFPSLKIWTHRDDLTDNSYWLHDWQQSAFVTLPIPYFMRLPFKRQLSTYSKSWSKLTTWSMVLIAHGLGYQKMLTRHFDASDCIHKIANFLYNIAFRTTAFELFKVLVPPYDISYKPKFACTNSSWPMRPKIYNPPLWRLQATFWVTLTSIKWPTR